jgi:rod shape-determining protein MreC
MDIPRHSEFSLGDTIVTSGYSAVFPEGIPVGTINEIKDSHDGLSYRLQVKLFTDFARLDNVCVIDYQNRKEQTMLEDSIK